MRSALILSALAVIAAAIPSPQELPIDAIDTVPDPDVQGPDPTIQTDPVDYDSSAAIKAAIADVEQDPPSIRKKRDGGCEPQPAGSGPVPYPDSPEAFLASSDIASTAGSAATPASYSQSFSNLNGSISSLGYMGLYTLTSYDVALCASKCNNAYPCQAFNIYFERDPTVNPSYGSACPNPPSLTNIKCTLWGYPVYAETAKNTGQWRSQFQVVIAGSNGYNRVLPYKTPSGWTGPTVLPGAINAPLLNGANTYMGYKFFKDIYDPSVCTAACDATTAYNRRHPSNCKYNVCRYVNAYILTENNVPQGFYCSMYSANWDPSYAANTGQTRGSDVYRVVDSVSFFNATADSGMTC
ncbi:hypothetical protein FGG08_006567 [Glutinoglossum americanum]|uniref:Uncharacterized protein n=1 Tax=Glutinoglossum americanum TaxID=1670608 RepID=A0A9P8I0N4_9PEZI|nr:hypothetical protein FGG08_006567 [Glutinoglossum americanum]